MRQRADSIVRRLAVAISTAFMLLKAALPAAAPLPLPATFATTIGNGLLCLDALDITFYFHYLSVAFGPPYKHAEGAYWFHTRKAKLWKVPISDLLVSDGRSNLLFLAAVAQAAPVKLEQAIAAETGIHYRASDAGKYARLTSNTGSNIVYFQNIAKIYCGKSEYLLPRTR